MQAAYASPWPGLNSMGTGDGYTGNDYAHFFGYPNGADALQLADRNRQFTHESLAAAYADGKGNKFLGSALEGLTAVDMDWPTTVCLALESRPDLSFSWNVMRFDSGLVDVVSAEGIPRLIKHSRQSGSATSIRHAVSMTMDHDFMTSPNGIRDWALQMSQMRRMVQRTLYFDVIFAVMNCNYSEDAWQRMYGIPPGAAALEERVNLETTQFGCMQKDQNAVEKLASKLMSHAKRMQWEPNMWIFPAGLQHYVKYCVPERLRYKFTGPSGIGQWMDAPPARTSIRGVNVYEAFVFDADEIGDSPPLMSKLCVIGEYNLLVDRYIDASQAGRCSEDRSIRIYDETKDNLWTATLEGALENSHRFDENGDIDVAHYEIARHSGSRDMFLYNNLSSQANEVASRWGQMTAKGLHPKTIHNVTASVIAKLSDADRTALDKLMALYNKLANVQAVAQGPLTANFYTKDARGKQNHFATGANYGNGGLGSWFGLETARFRDEDKDVAEAGIDAFVRFYDLLATIFGAEKNIVLDPNRCPAHLINAVEHKGACNLFERVVAKGCIPLFTKNNVFSNDAGYKNVTADQDDYIDIKQRHLQNVVKDHAFAAGEYFDAILRLLEDAHLDPSLSGNDVVRLAPVYFLKIVKKCNDSAKMKELLLASSGMLLGSDANGTERDILEVHDRGTEGITADKIAKYLAFAYSRTDDNDFNIPVGSPAAANKELAERLLAAEGAAFNGEAFSDFLTPLVVHENGSIGLNGAGGPFKFADYKTGFTTPLGGAEKTRFSEVDGFKHAVRHAYHMHPRPVAHYADGGVDSHMERVDGQMDFDDALHFTNCPPFLENYKSLNSLLRPMERAARAAFLYACINKAVCLSMTRGGIAIPFGAMLMRPLMKYQMGTVVLMKGGPSTGFTAYGHSNFMMSQDALLKTVFGHLTYFSRAIVHNNKHILKGDNVSYEKYLGGCGVKYFTADELEDLRAHDWIQDESQHVRDGPSLIATLIPAHSIELPKPLNLSPASGGGNLARKDYPSHDYYTGKLGFNQITGGEPGMMHYAPRNVNSVLFHGMEEYYQRSTGTFVLGHYNEGHHGPIVKPGCAAARGGGMQPLPMEDFRVEKS